MYTMHTWIWKFCGMIEYNVSIFHGYSERMLEKRFSFCAYELHNMNLFFFSSPPFERKLNEMSFALPRSRSSTEWKKAFQTKIRCVKQINDALHIKYSLHLGQSSFSFSFIFVYFIYSRRVCLLFRLFSGIVNCIKRMWVIWSHSQAVSYSVCFV